MMFDGRAAQRSGCAPPLCRTPGSLLLSMAAAAGLHAWLLYGAQWSSASAAPSQWSHQVTRITLSHPAQKSVTARTQQSRQVTLPSQQHGKTALQDARELKDAEAHDAPTPDAPQPTSTYVDESLLTARPSVSGDILIPFPPDAPEGVFKATLKLYIDEHGSVQQVDVEEISIPEPLANAAISAFKAARFAPGEVNGAPVKSTLSIEIVFNSGDVAATPNDLLSTTD